MTLPVYAASILPGVYFTSLQHLNFTAIAPPLRRGFTSR